MSSAPRAAEPLERHEVTIRYLEQTAPRAQTPLPRPGRALALMRAERPHPNYYRFLFNGVGEEHRWVSRRYMNDAELRRHTDDTDVHIYILYAEGSPVGFGEVDARTPSRAVIKFFGLMPYAQGEGLGRWFFREVTELAWQLRRGRVIIETCTLDNPRALRLYQREGFIIYDEARGLIEWYG